MPNNEQRTTNNEQRTQWCPEISIFMPVYNGEKYLTETLESILAQQFANFELLCVDDTSTDRSFDILQLYRTLDARIRVFQKPNGGDVPKSYNFALPYLRGRFVYYLSQDDLLSPDLLAQMIRRQQETGADVIVPDMVWYHGDAQAKANPRIAGVNGSKHCLTGMQAAQFSIDWSVHGFNLYRLDILRRLGGVAEFGLHSDEFTTRLLLLNSRTVSFSDGQFFYRQNNENAITKKVTLKRFDLLYVDTRLRQLFMMHRCSYDTYLKLIQLSLAHIHVLQQLTSELGLQEKHLAQQKIDQAQAALLADIDSISVQIQTGFLTWGEASPETSGC